MVDIRAHLEALRQVAPGRTTAPYDPHAWRERLLDGTLLVAFIQGALTVLPGVAAAISRGDRALLAVDGTALVCLAVITFRRGLDGRIGYANASARVVFLPKPVIRRELAAALQQALQGRAPDAEGGAT